MDGCFFFTRVEPENEFYDGEKDNDKDADSDANIPTSKN